MLPLGFAVAFALGSCSWSAIPASPIFQCERDGSCPDGLSCNRDNLCVAPATDDGGGCIPEAASEACSEAGLSCGELTRVDRCGALRSFTCGGCSDGGVCRGGACCALPTAAQACADAGYACGQLEFKACGRSLQFTCPSCVGTDVCIHGDHASFCAACVPESDLEFCQRRAATCGPQTGLDNCGGSRAVTSCGTCADGGCGSAAGPALCTCQPLLDPCLDAANCCSGACGAAGLCCRPAAQACNDDAECCTGYCVLGACIVPELLPDGGQTNGRP